MAIGRLDRFAKERKKVPVVSSSHHGSSSKKNAWKKMCKTYMNMTGVKIGNVKDRCWKKKKQLDKMVATKLSTTDSIIQHNDDKTCPGKEWLDGLEDWAMKMGILPSTSTSKSSRPPSSFHTRVKHSWRRRSQWWQKITKYNQRASLGLFSSQNFLSCLCTSSSVALCSNGTLVGTGIAYMAGAAVSAAISNFTQKNQTDYSTTAHATVTGMEERKRRKRRRDDVMDRAKKCKLHHPIIFPT